jgi:putative transposase
MKRSKFSEEQIAYALRQAEGGVPVADVCRQIGISEATYARTALVHHRRTVGQRGAYGTRP